MQVKIVVPQYVEEIELSKSRRMGYFEKGKHKIPEKYSNQRRYYYKPKGNKMCLYDNEEKEFVVSNPIAAGTPRISTIGGHYSGRKEGFTDNM